MKSCFAWAVLLVCAAAGTINDARCQEAIALSWPIDCTIGRTCFVQNYVDHDNSAEAKDYRCGTRTYDGHDGTDIRLVDTELEVSGVAVKAAAGGRVLRTRDGIDDVSVRTIGRSAVAGKECGNGVFVEHDGGWSTQYCHMRKGSIAVKPGDTVTAGQPLGQVGLSGDTEFPHLHLTVRLNGRVVDPFAFGQEPSACDGGRSLWTKALAELLQYRPREILNFGFSGVAATMELVESGELKRQPPSAASDVLVAFIRAIGLRKGDEQALSVIAPDGTSFAEYRVQALDTGKAQFFATAGRRRQSATWPAGVYAASYSVTSGGAEMLRKTFEVEIRN